MSLIHVFGDPLGGKGCDRFMKICGSSTSGGWLILSISCVLGVGDSFRVGGVWSGLPFGFTVFLSVLPIRMSGDPLGRVVCDPVMKVCGSSTGGGWSPFSISWALGVGDSSRVGGGWSGLPFGFLVFISVLPIHMSGDPLGRVVCDPVMKVCGSSTGGTGS